MDLRPLNVNDFFNYKNYIYNTGIGALTIVSDKQVVSVYNVPYNGVIGTGSHDNTINSILGKSYEFDNNVKIYQSQKRSVIGNLLRVHYVNSLYKDSVNKNMIIFLPKVMTLDKLDKLKALRDYYKEVFKNNNITVSSCFTEFDENGNDLMYSLVAEDFIEDEVNSIDRVIEKAESLVDVSYLPELPEERILKLK